MADSGYLWQADFPLARPAGYDLVMASHSQQIQLSDEQLRMLSEWSARTGKSVEEVLTDALRDYNPTESQNGGQVSDESLLARLTRSGLVGCLNGGLSDLSTNPAHMEGFGE